MKKVLFFIENDWAFGTIHQSLTKVLYGHDILADVLDWRNQYTPEEMDLINESYDYFVTLPLAVNSLTSYKIPLEKIILVAHGQWDLLKANELSDNSVYDKVHDYAVVSEELKQISIDLGIKRVPAVTTVGIIVDNFIKPVPQKLETIGYASAFEHQNYRGEDIKRGRLAKAVAYQTGLKLVLNQKFNYLGMPGFYKSVDAVIMTSTEESVGLPMLEAAAAGRLTIGTPIGYYHKNGKRSGGIVAPLDEDDFIKEVCIQVELLKLDPMGFSDRCQKIQNYAKKHYDWSSHISPWVNLFTDSN